MPKKMARLEEQPDFRPFRFRIQAFTNAFQAEVYRRGITEEECGIKKIRQYLWTQKLVARFNEDGKKAKSRGNHIWVISARKLPSGGWNFREFRRRIAGVPRKAYVGMEWRWQLRIWDPQVPSSSIRAVYSAPILPSWIKWEDENEKNVLIGKPNSSHDTGHIRVVAHYVYSNQLHELEHSVNLQIIELDVNAEPPSATGPQPMGPDAISDMAGDPDATVPSQAHDVLPSQMDVKMAASEGAESVKEGVVAPSQVTNVLQSISFPFTPPIMPNGAQQPFFMGATAPHMASAAPQIAPVQQMPTVPQVPSQMPAMDSMALQAAHLRAAIEQRQQDFAKQLPLAIPPERRPSADAAAAAQAAALRQMPQLSHQLSFGNAGIDTVLSPAMPLQQQSSMNEH